MSQIPRSALLLGLLGVLPFAWGVLTMLQQDLSDVTIRVIGPRFVGPYVQLFYGAVILSFMSGVLWGFATRANGKEATLGYIFSVLPALWAFFTTGGGEETAAQNLILGFLGLLMFDWYFHRKQLTPAWWMSLRVLLTTLVVIFLGLGAMI